MTDFKLSLAIEANGDKEALAKFEGLSAAGKQITERFAKATGVSLDQAIAKWKELGDKAAESMLKQSVAAEKAEKTIQDGLDRRTQMLGRAEVAAYRMQAAMDASKVKHFAESELEAAEGAEHHSIALGRVERSLESYIVRTTGANEQTGLLAAAFGHLELGSVPMIGILAGLFAVTKAYELLTAKTREAKEEQEKLIAKIAEAANAGHPDAIREEARKLQFGQPFDKDGKLRANSEFAPGAFEGSLADLQGKLRSLTDQFYATTNGFAQIAIQKQMIAVKAQLKPMEEMMARLQSAGANLASQPSDTAGKLPTVTTSAPSPDGAFARAMKMDEERIKGLALSGQLSAGRIGQLQDEAAKWTAIANALGLANPKYEQYLALAKQADDLVKRQGNLADTASRAMAEFNKDGALAIPEQPGSAARSHLLDKILPTSHDIAEQMKYTISIALDEIKNDPMVIRGEAVVELGKHLGQMIAHGMADGLVQALDAGFQKAFSGSGAVGFLEGFGQSILASLGTIMEQMGAALLTFGLTMTILAHALKNPVTAGPAAIGVGIALMALGAALNAAVNGKGSSGASAGSFSGGSGLPEIIDRGVINPDSYSSRNPAGIQPRPNNNYNVTIIGPNDPNAQRVWDELQRKSQQRGSLVPA